LFNFPNNFLLIIIRRKRVSQVTAKNVGMGQLSSFRRIPARAYWTQAQGPV